MNKINHHPTMETLQLYAAGHLEEARIVIISTHLELCDQCRHEIYDLETIGGICLEAIQPVAIKADALDDFWKKAKRSPSAPPTISTTAHNDFNAEITHPLRHHINGNLDTVKWRKVIPGISQYVLKISDAKPHPLRLLKINPNVQIPTHTHENNELTLILRGAYEDEIGIFREGDLADLDANHNHSPKAIGDEPCICLIATTGALEFKGMLPKIAQSLIGL